MRIRFTLDITRTPKPETAPDNEPPFIQDNGYTHIEHSGADTPPLGFTPNPTNPWQDKGAPQ